MVWALMVILRKAALNHLNVFTVLVWSRTVTVAVIAAALFATGRSVRIRVPGTVRYVILLGLLNFVLNWLAVQGMQWTTATQSAVLFKTDIVFTIVLGWVFLGEKVQFAQVPMVVLALAGCLMVVWPASAEASASTATAPRPLAGNLLCVAFGLVLTINAILIKAKLAELGKLQLAFWNALIGFGFFVAAWLGGDHVAADMAQIARRPALAAILAGAGAVAAVVFITYYQAIWNLPVWVVRVLLLLSPACAAVLAKWLWAEKTTLTHLAGMVLLLGGTACVVVSGRQKPSPNGGPNG